MARRRGASIGRVDVSASAEVVRDYWSRLSAPAVFPWAGCGWDPVSVGPTWQTDGHGFWLLPERTLGWAVLGWIGANLSLNGVPFRPTLEQARFGLWWYAVDESGRFVFYDGVLQRLKGWGKDPLISALAAVEAFGPCRFGGWDDHGHPIAVPVGDSWVQVAATALEQTKNTFRLFPGLFTAAARKELRLAIGKETVYGSGDRQFVQAVTSSPATLEGNRATAIFANETQHWDGSNNGFEMAAVIDRNVTKAPDGSSRRLAITNAPDPAKDSVGLRDREAWEEQAAGRTVQAGILYDSLEAPPEAPLTADAAPAVLVGVRGDSVWLDVDRIVMSILDVRNPPSRSRRFFYNQLTATEDSLLDPQDIDAVAADLSIGFDEECVLFFDGSKSDDATGLVMCRLSNGDLFTSGVWQRPSGGRGDGWVVPRHEVDRRVRDLVQSYRVVALWADPSHAKDDEALGWWDTIIDGWHRDFHDRFRLWAVAAGSEKHSVMWDMTSPDRQRTFTTAAEQFVAEVQDSAEMKRLGRPDDMVVRFDGHPMMRQHLRNAKEYPNRFGTSLWKGHRSSSRKIDLAVCAVGARMLRRAVLNRPASDGDGKSGKKPGKVW